MVQASSEQPLRKGLEGCNLLGRRCPETIGEKGKETKERSLNKQITTEDKRDSVALGTLGDRGSWRGQCVRSAW